MDIVVEGRFLIDGELKQMAVGIEDGKIATMGKLVRGGDERLEFTSGIITPGFIDPHVHFREPGMTAKEDFGSGTMSALFGGVTCVLDMPNTNPPTTDIRTLSDKKASIRRKAHVDYGLFAALTPNMDVNRLAPHVAGFKLFMGSTTGNILMNDDNEIGYLMGDIARSGKVLSVHAEDDDMILRDREESNWDHLRNRPVEAEHNAVRRLSRYRGMRINICHVTDAATAEMAKANGFTTEVTLHHMMFAAENVEGTEYKVNPPIRDLRPRDALCRSVEAGNITMFGSDHAPHTQTDKMQEYATAPGGMIGVETTIPILMNWAMHGRFPLPLLERMGCSNPASVFSLNKGRIKVGMDADLVFFDTKNVTRIDPDALHSKAGHTAYAGTEAIFPDTVMLRGNIQIQDGEYCGSATGVDTVDHPRD